MEIFILGSGSKGNSTIVRSGNTTILIDVGFSYKELVNRMEKVNVYPKDIDYVFITHDHSDHISGLKVLLHKINAKVYIDKRIINVFEYLRLENNVNELLDENIIESNIVVKMIPTSHDATSSCGYLLDDGAESMVIITDTGYINERNFIYLKNKTYYLLESNHDVIKLRNGRYPIKLQDRILSSVGHLSNEMSAFYATKMIGPDTKKIILCHLSEENNTPELALEAYKKTFKDYEISFNNIDVASQYVPMEVK